jgi:hypothetical protein
MGGLVGGDLGLHREGEIAEIAARIDVGGPVLRGVETPGLCDIAERALEFRELLGVRIQREFPGGMVAGLRGLPDPARDLSATRYFAVRKS